MLAAGRYDVGTEPRGAVVVLKTSANSSTRPGILTKAPSLGNPSVRATALAVPPVEATTVEGVHSIPALDPFGGTIRASADVVNAISSALPIDEADEARLRRFTELAIAGRVSRPIRR